MNIILSVADPKALEAIDVPIAIMAIAAGVFAVAIRNQQLRARADRVRRGELSLERAAKIDRFMSWAGYAIAACGVVILVLHFVAP